MWGWVPSPRWDSSNRRLLPTARFSLYAVRVYMCTWDSCVSYYYRPNAVNSRVYPHPGSQEATADVHRELDNDEHVNRQRNVVCKHQGEVEEAENGNRDRRDVQMPATTLSGRHPSRDSPGIKPDLLIFENAGQHTFHSLQKRRELQRCWNVLRLKTQRRNR